MLYIGRIIDLPVKCIPKKYVALALSKSGSYAVLSCQSRTADAAGGHPVAAIKGFVRTEFSVPLGLAAKKCLRSVAHHRNTTMLSRT